MNPDHKDNLNAFILLYDVLFCTEKRETEETFKQSQFTVRVKILK